MKDDIEIAPFRDSYKIELERIALENAVLLGKTKSIEEVRSILKASQDIFAIQHPDLPVLDDEEINNVLVRAGLSKKRFWQRF